MKAIIENREHILIGITEGEYATLKGQLDTAKSQVAALSLENEKDDAEILRLQMRVIELEEALKPPVPVNTIELYYLEDGVKYKLRDGYRLTGGLPTNIVAEPSIDGPVEFILSGAEAATRNETAAPYALKGDSNGVFNLWTPIPGNYTLTASSGGVIVTVEFVVDEPVVKDPTPIPSGDVMFDGDVDRDAVVIGAGTYGTSLLPWEKTLEGKPEFRDVYFGMDSSLAQAKVITLNGSKVIEAKLFSPLDGKRVQLGMVIDNIPWRTWKMESTFMIHPDVEKVRNYEGAIGGVPWLVFFETWMKRVEKWSGDPPARMNVGIKKEKGIGQPLKWELRNQYIQPSPIAYTNIAPAIVSSAPVVFGEFVTWEITLKEGEGTNGRFTLVQKRVGKPNEVVFDYIGTTVYPNEPGITRGTFNLWKFYSERKAVEVVPAGQFIAYYKGIKIYK